MERITLITKPSKDYELLDSGKEEKLERYGKYILRRPDPQALWNKNLLEEEWKKADSYFERKGEKGGWKKNNKEMQNEWQISLGNLKFNIKPTIFKHTGVFPEQEMNWNWVKQNVEDRMLNDSKFNIQNSVPKILNLFGYTGGITLAALSAGAEVTHVDSSKFSVEWAKENAELSGLKDKPVRWLIDDAKKFVKREMKRGVKYDGIIMDPPTFGKSDTGIWKIEEDLPKLLADCSQILSDKPLLFLINGYASGYSAQSYLNLIKPILEKYGGEFEIGELVIEEAKTARFLPAGIFARWSLKSI